MDKSNPNPARCWEMFNNGKSAENIESALKLAEEMSKDYPILEYGVSIIRIDMTFEEMKTKAKDILSQELVYIKENYPFLSKLYVPDIEKTLEKIDDVKK